MKVALVGCGKEKLDRAAPARELYTGPLFRAARAWAEAFADRWFILSAKHGLVEPDAVIEPYDVTLRGMAREARADWARTTALAIRAAIPADARITVLAASEYARFDEHVPNSVVEPLLGLELGQRLAWFKREARLAGRIDLDELYERMREAADAGALVEFSPDEARALLAARRAA